MDPNIYLSAAVVIAIVAALFIAWVGDRNQSVILDWVLRIFAGSLTVSIILILVTWLVIGIAESNHYQIGTLSQDYYETIE